MTDNLRAALEAALPDLTDDQAHAARTLVVALAPPMDDEPKWPGAPVIAACSGGTRRSLHVRRNDGSASGWECQYSCDYIEWDRLGNPQPLTPAEYEKYGIPMPAEPITDELLDRCARVECGDGWEPLTNRSRFRAALRAAGHPEAGE